LFLNVLKTVNKRSHPSVASYDSVQTIPLGVALNSSTGAHLQSFPTSTSTAVNSNNKKARLNDSLPSSVSRNCGICLQEPFGMMVSYTLICNRVVQFSLSLAFFCLS
jgi:hypothetical protein